jgi:LmbE family N-acetylglucosaminyl deacetylase
MELANNRRQFVKNAALGLGTLSFPDLVKAKQVNDKTKKKIVCVGGHPDDPETGCGGTMALLANAGHDVTIIYLTTGEAGIEGTSHDDAAAIRKQESIAACKILKAKPVFAGQIDADTVFNTEWITKMRALIETEQPDILLTHWPIDSHKDHQAASLLAVQSWIGLGEKFPLYFFEVCAGLQTIGFHPTDYIDISSTRDQKKRSVYCHTSQHPESIYAKTHTKMEEFRGLEIGSSAAEAFVKMNGKSGSALLI